jgi:LCP family protein required for cell wall assembly
MGALRDRALIALGVVVAIVVATFALVMVVVGIKLGAAEQVDLLLADAPAGGGGNYLLIGSDTRSFVSDAADAEAFGDEGDAGGQRSDTIMVLHFDPDSPRSLLVSFPRDLWVDIPGTGESKLNAAFNDGPQSVVDTLDANFGVPIHHYVEVNFATFRDLVDAVGTVPVYFPAPARDALAALDVPVADCVELDGAAALSFVRSRNLELLDPATGRWDNADAIPDLGRIGRQQAFLRVLGQQAMDRAFTNPFAANDIVDQAVGKLTLDSDFGRIDAFRLAAAFAGDGDGNGALESQAVPTEPASRSGQSVLIATDDAEAMFERLRDFETVAPSSDVDTATPATTRVRVLNATNVSGLAGEALADLVDHGFVDRGVGNTTDSLEVTEVRYRGGADGEAALVASFVIGPVELIEDDSIGGADVQLRLGTTFEQITPPPTGGAPAAAPPEVGIPQPASLAPIPGEC